jgi:S1-C subfamily serine protease
MYKKMFYFLFIVLFLNTAIFSSDDIKKEPDEKLHIQCIYPTVKITDENQKIGGSGFIVKSVKHENLWYNSVFTASHVVEDQSELVVHVSEYKDWSELKKENVYPLELFARDSKRDLAIAFFVSENKMPVVNLEFDSKIYINTEVFNIGHALFDDGRINYGHVTQPKTLRPIVFFGMIRTSCYAFMGDSGGPLFLKKNYNVIGMCHGIRSHQNTMLSNISYFQPINEILNWNKELNNVLEPAYNEKNEFPKIPFVKLNLRNYDYQLPMD